MFERRNSILLCMYALIGTRFIFKLKLFDLQILQPHSAFVSAFQNKELQKKPLIIDFKSKPLHSQFLNNLFSESKYRERYVAELDEYLQKFGLTVSEKK